VGHFCVLWGIRCGDASDIYNLFRNIGGSIGISVAFTLLIRHQHI
jgi:hypothetical protein